MNEKKVNKWFVFSDLGSYFMHENMIGNVLKKNKWGRVVKEQGELEPATDAFLEIANGDIVVYFAQTEGVVVGLFEVDDPPEEGTEKKKSNYLLVDDEWYPSIIHYIKPYLLPTDEKFLDFKKLLRQNEKTLPFESFHDLSELESKTVDVQHHVCQKLSENDYQRIKEALSDPLYLVDSGVEVVNGEKSYSLCKCEIGILSSMLDFYNNRSTSFASLFVASVFGLVTLSAIITSIDNNYQAVISLIPYFIFAFAGVYTLGRYSFYAGIAERIKSNGIGWSYRSELNKPKVGSVTDGKFKVRGLGDWISKTERDQNFSIPKRFLRWHYAFPILYIATILTLTIVVYWDYIMKLVKHF